MIISIAGGTGSGKSTLANELKNLYQEKHNATVITMDSYYKNSRFESFENYDHPDAFNSTLLYNDLVYFKAHNTITKRLYNYENKESVIIEKSSEIDVLIVEGLYPFYDAKLRTLYDLKIYIDVNEEIRLKRRIQRDLLERNITKEENLRMINTFVKEMHRKYVSTQKKFADNIYTQREDIYTLMI